MKKNNIALITRPKPEAIKLKKKLAAIGIEALIEPILEIKIIKSSNNQLKKALSGNNKTIIITSVNGAKALIKFGNLSAIRNLDFIVAGTASLKLLKKAGFKNVKSSGENAKSLKDYIFQNLNSKKDELLYLSGNIVTIDMEAELSQKGYGVKRIVMYNSLPSSNLSLKTKEFIKAGAIRYALFYSIRTAAVFNRLINESDLNKYLDKVDAFCFSPKIAETINRLPWNNIEIPKRPNESELINLLKKHLTGKKVSYED